MIKKSIGLKIFVALVVAVVVIVAGIGFYLSGTPSHTRAEKLDQQRVNDLMQIANAVETYYMTKDVLPTTLHDLKNQKYAYIESLADPVTHEPYEYRETLTGSYELCATFQTDNTKDNVIQARPAYPVGFGNTWQHPVGKKCFELKVSVKRDKPLM